LTKTTREHSLVFPEATPSQEETREQQEKVEEAVVFGRTTIGLAKKRDEQPCHVQEHLPAGGWHNVGHSTPTLKQAMWDEGRGRQPQKTIPPQPSLVRGGCSHPKSS
jgi:hypothetical protein